MSRDRKKGRRPASRAFRPELGDGRLEARLVMTQTSLALGQYLLTHPNIGNAFKFNNPQFVRGSKALPFVRGQIFNHGVIDVQTARGGSSVVVAAPDGSRFRVSLTLADNQYDGGLTAETGSSGTGVIPTSQVQPIGTVRAYPMTGGRVGLIVDGATQYQQLTIDPLPFSQRKGYAHSFAYLEANRSHVLNIGSLQVNGGALQAVLGFHSADLSGPLSIGGTGTVDRIAFDSLLPGASIGVGGNLNTLDVANNATLSAGAGVTIGGDLNLLNVGGNLTLTNGASILVNRFIGLTPQPPKGTGTGSNILSVNQALLGTGTSTVVPSLSAYIQGDVTIGPGSTLAVTSGVANSSLVGGTGGSPSPIMVNGALRIASGTYVEAIGGVLVGKLTSPQVQIPNLVFLNQFVPGVNFFARNGLYIGGTQVLPPS
jgi:hypothetical protein